MNKSTLHGFLEYLDVRKNEEILKEISGEKGSYVDGTGGHTEIGKEKTDSVWKMVGRKGALNTIEMKQRYNSYTSDFTCYL